MSESASAKCFKMKKGFLSRFTGCTSRKKRLVVIHGPQPTKGPKNSRSSLVEESCQWDAIRFGGFRVVWAWRPLACRVFLKFCRSNPGRFGPPRPGAGALPNTVELVLFAFGLGLGVYGLGSRGLGFRVYRV